MDINIEAVSRARKATCLARTAWRHGAAPDHLDLVPVREMLLSLTPRPANKHHLERWDLASEQTWAEAKAILEVLSS